MAITEYYIDPAIDANSGTGTIGDPFGDLQYALDTVTRDGTNGDRFNVKAGTAEVLTAEVWALRADRRAGTLVVVAADGRKFATTLETEFLPKTRFLEDTDDPRNRVFTKNSVSRSVKAIKSIKAQPDAGQE